MKRRSKIPPKPGREFCSRGPGAEKCSLKSTAERYGGENFAWRTHFWGVQDRVVIYTCNVPSKQEKVSASRTKKDGRSEGRGDLQRAVSERMGRDGKKKSESLAKSNQMVRLFPNHPELPRKKGGRKNAGNKKSENGKDLGGKTGLVIRKEKGKLATRTSGIKRE